MSELERSFLTQMKYRKLPTPQQEWRFLPDRRFRFDFAYPEYHIGIEVEGATRFGPIGRHQSYDGFTKDCEKYSLAALNGWLVIRVTQEHINSGIAFEWVKKALEVREVAA